MSDSIFNTQSIDRNESKWESRLFDLTPFELHDGIWLKREDKFAPLGYGGPNGSKLRQLLYLFTQNIDKKGIVSGASVKSPQLSMGTIVAHHFGMASHLVVGATKPTTALRHPNVNIASRFGAEFDIIKVGYNPALQSRVKALKAQERHKDYWQLEYGITLDHTKHPAEAIEAFHRVGSQQVQNLPDCVETLIMPAGSCNSLVSVLYGLARFRPKTLKTLKTYGIGPERMAWVYDRCTVIESVSGVLITDLFTRLWPQFSEQANAQNPPNPTPYMWCHHNLQTEGFCDYQMEMKESWADVVLHPTYEGKIMRWLKTHGNLKQRGTEAFWIVGSAPDFDNFSQFAVTPEHKTLPLLEDI